MEVVKLKIRRPTIDGEGDMDLDPEFSTQRMSFIQRSIAKLRDIYDGMWEPVIVDGKKTVRYLYENGKDIQTMVDNLLELFKNETYGSLYDGNRQPDWRTQEGNERGKARRMNLMFGTISGRDDMKTDERNDHNLFLQRSIRNLDEIQAGVKTYGLSKYARMQYLISNVKELLQAARISDKRPFEDGDFGGSSARHKLQRMRNMMKMDAPSGANLIGLTYNGVRRLTPRVLPGELLTDDEKRAYILITFLNEMNEQELLYTSYFPGSPPVINAIHDLKSAYELELDQAPRSAYRNALRYHQQNLHADHRRLYNYEEVPWHG